MAIYNLSGDIVVCGIAEGYTEVGGINEASGFLNNATTFVSSRSEKTYMIGGDGEKTITVEVSNLLSESDYVYAFLYDGNGAFTRYIRNSGSKSVFVLSANEKLLKLQITHTSNEKRREHFTISADAPISEVGNPNIINTTIGDSLAFCYSVNNDAETSGRLLLPPNYTVDGLSVPLIVFAHGSGSMWTWEEKLGHVYTGGSHLSYLPFLQYLANEGFAVFDCFPWTNGKTIPANAYSPFGLPIHKEAYLKGIEYVCDRFNVDINRVSVLCKSQGGHFGQWAIMQNRFPFKAVALFAPSCGLSGTLFFNATCREAIAEWVDFEGTTAEIEAFITSGKYYDSDDSTKALVRSFVEKNKATLLSMCPMCQGITNGNADDLIIGAINSQTTVPQWMIDLGLPSTRPTGAQPIFTMSANADYVKNGFIPSKFWCAFDDDQGSGYSHYSVYHWLKNGCSDTQWREMPVGSGGHNATDLDANAPKSSGTTALGITYTNVPTAYVEVVEFIRSKCGG